MLKSKLVRRKSKEVQYELYIDVFFLINFLMDYLLLLTVRQVLKWESTQLKVILSAGIGALLSSILLFLNIPEEVKQIILHFGGSFIMIKIAFSFTGKQLIRGWSIFYFTGILMGGVFLFISQQVGKNITTISLFTGIAAGTYFLTRKILDYAGMYIGKLRRKYTITLVIGTEKIKFKALLDTGNMLIDSITGEKVHIISIKAIKKFTKGCSVMRYIPYQTVQGENKVMPLIKGECMYIHGKKEQLIENPYFAISECMDFGNGDYQIILHPDCIREVRNDIKDCCRKSI